MRAKKKRKFSVAFIYSFYLGKKSYKLTQCFEILYYIIDFR